MSELPNEVWEHIFWHLSAQQLLLIRLTCHRFRNIVSSCPVLRDKLCLRFSINERDQEFNPLPVPAATNVMFSSSKLRNITSWWTSIGEMVTSLTLNECSFQMDMLASTPNLKRLDISKGSFDEQTLDFQLNKMEYLVLAEANSAIGESIVRITPHLIGLDISKCLIDLDHIDTWLQMIEVVQTTLHEIKVDAEPTILEGLSELPQLKLKRVTIMGNWNCWTDESALLEFARSQPTIEKLDMRHLFVREKVLQDPFE